MQRQMNKDDVESALTALTRARSGAMDVCRDYAAAATGWAVGDRVMRHKRGQNIVIEITAFRGMHPQTRAIKPMLIAKHVRVDGSTGTKDVYVEIDMDDGWRRQWTREIKT